MILARGIVLRTSASDFHHGNYFVKFGKLFPRNVENLVKSYTDAKIMEETQRSEFSKINSREKYFNFFLVTPSEL